MFLLKYRWAYFVNSVKIHRWTWNIFGLVKRILKSLILKNVINQLKEAITDIPCLQINILKGRKQARKRVSEWERESLRSILRRREDGLVQCRAVYTSRTHRTHRTHVLYTVHFTLNNNKQLCSVDSLQVIIQQPDR